MAPPSAHSTNETATIVLAGIGHTNAHVVRAWGLAPLSGVRLVCVSPFVDATYSGMLPGVLAGQYPPAAMRINLRRLCESVGAELIVGEVAGCDRTRQELVLESGERVRYDFLSIGVGSRARDPAPASPAPSLVPIKPMQTFLERLAERVAELTAHGTSSSSAARRLAIVGSGAGGTEVALCLGPWLERTATGQTWQIALVGSDTLPARALGSSAGRQLLAELRRRGIDYDGGRRVRQVAPDRLVYDTGDERPVDLVIWATDAVAPRWFDALDLSRDGRGFVLTRPTLESLDDPRIFAVGDAGTMAEQPLPKAGVYAVRQGPILWGNLQRALAGQPRVAYHPQRRFLKLLNLGDGRGLGEYAGWTFTGRWVWRWKNRIDSQFMQLYQR